MSLWGNNDNATGNNKPKYANTSYRVSNSTINGNKAVAGSDAPNWAIVVQIFLYLGRFQTK